MSAPKLKLAPEPKKPRRSRDGLDAETRELRRVLLERDKVLEQLRLNDQKLAKALREWTQTRPGERGGITTETEARILFGRMGLLG